MQMQESTVGSRFIGRCVWESNSRASYAALHVRFNVSECPSATKRVGGDLVIVTTLPQWIYCSAKTQKSGFAVRLYPRSEDRGFTLNSHKENSEFSFS